MELDQTETETDMEKLKPAALSSQPSTQQSNSRKTLILQRQRILFSAFRADQYADPDGFLMSLGLVLEQYPDDVIVWVTDPRTGVQRGLKFPPTISEVVEACDNRAAELARHERYRNWGKGNEGPRLGPPTEKRLTADELKAKYGGPDWGLSEPPRAPPVPAPTWAAIAKGYGANPDRMAHLIRLADGQHPEPLDGEQT